MRFFDRGKDQESRVGTLERPHEPIEFTEGGVRSLHDRRWVEIRRPTVVVVGELTMASRSRGIKCLSRS
jgi:hypothetical protein